MKLTGKIDESASDVVGYGIVTWCHRHCGGRYVFLKMVISVLLRGLCVLEACDVRIELVPWMNLPRFNACSTMRSCFVCVVCFNLFALQEHQELTQAQHFIDV